MARILIIDDDESTRSVLEDVLSYVGYETATARGVVDSIQKAQSYQPDLLLCDWHLMDGSGADIIDQLPGIKTIVMTAHDEQDIVQPYASQISSYILIKPHTIDALLEAIRETLG